MIYLEFESPPILRLQYRSELFAILKREGPWFQKTTTLLFEKSYQIQNVKYCLLVDNTSRPGSS